MKKQHLITGGAGFIGTNLAINLMGRGESVIILDNFSRKGSIINSQFLKEKFPQVKICRGDIRLDSELLKELIKKADVVYHLASQVAVTTSVENPRHDFETNTLGTFNILESVRTSNKKAILIYASTNKVYGNMENIETEELPARYRYKNYPMGISETQNLDFHSPYGCSKGAGDQYVRDYARIYGLKTIVFRQSAIYGPRQFGMEDQGWVAWFLIAAVMGKPITIYGDGKQVRDLLYIDDLINAYTRAVEKIDKTGGQVYNIGGGPKNNISVWEEFGPILEKLVGKKINIRRGPWRPGDQRIFIADIRKAKRELGWKPKISPEVGIEKLYRWAKDNQKLLASLGL